MRLEGGATREVQVLSREMPAPGSRKSLRRREAGWRATGGEHAVCRMANTIRPGTATSLLGNGEVQTGTRVQARGLLEVCLDPDRAWELPVGDQVSGVPHAGRAAKKR